jgi:hypothetical protein
MLSLHSSNSAPGAALMAVDGLNPQSSEHRQNERMGAGAPGRTTGRDVGRGPQNVHAAETKGPFRSFLPRPSVAQTATGSQEHAYAWPLPSRRGRAGDVRGGH